MPFDDFQRQIDWGTQPDFDALGACAERYKVSLIAAIRRWLQDPDRRSDVVVSRDRFIL
jgi:hypothetical protein